MAERYVDVIYGHEDAVKSIGYSPDGTLLISGGNEGKVRFWNLQKRRCVEECDEFKSSVRCVGFSPDGKHWAAMDREGSIRIHSIDGSQGNTKGMPASGFRWLPDSKNLICSNNQGRVFLYNLLSKQPLFIQRHPDSEVYALACSPDGRYIISAGSDRVIRGWDLTEGRELTPLEGNHGNAITALAFSPDSLMIGSGDKGSMCGYNYLKNGWGKLSPFSFQWSGHEITDVAFCPCYNIFATCGTDNRIKLFDIDNANRRLEDLTGHNRQVNTIAFSPCGKYLASGAGDHKIMIWNVKKPNYVS